MKKAFLFAGLQSLWLTASSQNLPFDTSAGVHFQCTNLAVLWKAPKHPWPKTLWTYRVAPTRFSPTVISNLMALGSFTDKDKRDYGTNGMIFGKPLLTPHLDISFLEGEIAYEGAERHYSPTNLAKDVPGTNRLPQLTTEFLPKLGIAPSEIARGKNGRPAIGWHGNTTDRTLYYTDDSVVTNIEYREVRFARALDGVEFKGDGGFGEIYFGEHSQIVKIRLHWRSVERDKFYPSATPNTVTQWIREGKAIQKHMASEHGPETTIDWATVESLTIKTAKPYYWGEFFFDRERTHQPILPSRVLPYAEISGTVNTRKTNLNVELVCPIIDETTPLGRRATP